MPDLFKPDYRFSLVTDITAPWLKKEGFSRIVLDVDNTFLARKTFPPKDENLAWLKGLKDEGFDLVFTSNNGGAHTDRLEEMTGVHVVTWACKPFPVSFFRAAKFAPGAKEKTLVVGDQLLTDVLGARVYGCRVALVTPLGGKEFILTRLMRLVEKIVG